MFLVYVLMMIKIIAFFSLSIYSKIFKIKMMHCNDLRIIKNI